MICHCVTAELLTDDRRGYSSPRRDQSSSRCGRSMFLDFDTGPGMTKRAKVEMTSLSGKNAILAGGYAGVPASWRLSSLRP
jgi:hypothetical protein